MEAVRIAIFASGAGSNAARIISYFSGSSFIQVALVVASRENAGVLKVAEDAGIPSVVLNRGEQYEAAHILPLLDKYTIRLIVLAGFLRKVPDSLIEAFRNRIINIHPALLPRYGGKGMYGAFVHQAVKTGGDVETGITVHLVNEHYDEGRILFQATCPVLPEESAEEIEKKVRILEHAHYPAVIEKFAKGEL